MAKRILLLCGIYENRPERCKEYPTSEDWLPANCTFWFDAEGNRRGHCTPGCGACCLMPRANGEPLAPFTPADEGGLPCKYLEVYIESESGSIVKVGSAVEYIGKFGSIDPAEVSEVYSQVEEVLYGNTEED